MKLKISITIISIISLLLSGYTSFNYFSNKAVLGTSITTINGSDTLKDSRTTINDNFTALNNGKLENSAYYATTTHNNISSLPSLSSIGTITTGNWNGTDIPVTAGGSGRDYFTANSVLLGNGTSPFATTSAGTNGQVLGLTAGVPTWQSPSVDTAINYSWSGVHNFTGTSTTFTGTTSFSGIATCNTTPINSTDIINKIYADTNYNGKYATTSGAIIQYSNTAEISAVSTIAKTFQLLIPGIISVSWSSKVSTNDGTDGATVAMSAFTSSNPTYTLGAFDLGTSYATSTANLFLMPGQYTITVTNNNGRTVYIKDLFLTFGVANIGATYAY